MLSSLGNCATYLVKKRTDSEAPWVFDVNYINLAASLIYGYAIIVPVAFYFSLRYMGSRADLLRFWCLWGYSLFIFVPTTVSVSVCLIHKWLCSLVPSMTICTVTYNQPNSHWSFVSASVAYSSGVSEMGDYTLSWWRIFLLCCPESTILPWGEQWSDGCSGCSVWSANGSVYLHQSLVLSLSVSTPHDETYI